jgi:excisionase family DNA binding protein
MATNNAHSNGNGPMLTPRQAADRLQVRVTWIYDRVKTGELKGFRLGKFLRIDAGDLDRFVDARQVR